MAEGGYDPSRIRTSDDESSSSDSSGTITPGNSEDALTPINSPVGQGIPTIPESSPSGIGAASRIRSQNVDTTRERARIPRSRSDPYFLSHPVAEGAAAAPSPKRAQPSWFQEAQSGPSRLTYNPILRSQYNFTSYENRGHYLRRRGSFSDINLETERRNPRAGILDDDNLLLIKEQIIRHTETIKCSLRDVKRVLKNKFNVVKGVKLGEGGYGSAFIGTKVGSDQKLAIKIYDGLESPYKIGDIEKTGIRGEKSQKALIESLHEIMVMKALKGHPYIIQYVNHFIINDHIYVIMELGDDTLEGQVEFYRHGMPEAKARKWFFEVAAGITYMHKIGIVHSDLKPDNVLIKRFGYKSTVARICDFGWSRFLPHASVGIKGDSRVGMIRARTVGRDPEREDPEIKQLRQVMKVPRNTLPNDSFLLKDGTGYQAIVKDQCDLGIILASMLSIEYRIAEIANTPHEVFMNWALVTGGEFVTRDGKDLLWKLLSEDATQIATMKQLNPDRNRRLMKHHWFGFPGIEPGLKRDPLKTHNLALRSILKQMQ